MRINFFGGPGSGKSTTTARVFSQLKELGISVEHVGEYVKSWAYQKRGVKKWDQLYLFGKQHQYEYRNLSAGVKNIVTDSPCFLSVIYGHFYGSHDDPIATSIARLHAAYDADFPSIHIFLDRGNKPYDPVGRYQDYETAKAVDEFTKKTLTRYGMKFIELDYQDKSGILAAALKAVDT